MRCLRVSSDEKNAELNNGPIHGSAVHLKKLLVHACVLVFCEIGLPRYCFHCPFETIHFSFHVTQVIMNIGIFQQERRNFIEKLNSDAK